MIQKELQISLIFIFIFTSGCISPGPKKISESAANNLDTLIVLNNMDRVDALIKGGVDINSPNTLGYRPIHVAIINKNSGIAELLLKNGASANFNGPFSKISYPPNILKWREKAKNFFLTFDLGMENNHLDFILNLLKKYNITATFFVTGIFIKKFPADTARIVNEGHVVGNHTLTHAVYYTGRTQLINELRAADKLFMDATGYAMAGIWRAPGLQHIYRSWQVDAAFAAGFRHIDVSLLNLDYLPPHDERYISNDKFMTVFAGHINANVYERFYIEKSNYDFLTRNVKRADYNGLILLMHSKKYRGGNLDFIYCLEPIILHLLKNGYLFDNFRRFGVNGTKIKGL